MKGVRVKKWIELIFEWSTHEEKVKSVIGGEDTFLQSCTNETESLLSFPRLNTYAIISKIGPSIGLSYQKLSGIYFTLTGDGKVDYYKNIEAGTFYRGEFDDMVNIRIRFIEMSKELNTK